MINEPESELATGNELGKLDQMPPEFELSFKFYINQIPTTGFKYNLFHGMNDNTEECTESTAGEFLRLDVLADNVTD